MKIIKVNIAEFGCIKNKEIVFDSGFNIVSGENESGKSTVMLFIKYMLYGLPRRTSKSTDRERALSWSGNQASGTMLLENEGVQYLIERRSSATARGEVCKLTNLANGETIDRSPAEFFLGVPSEVFDSSCAISQMRSTEINGTHTAVAIENILSGADENIDTARILGRLDKVRKEYKLNKGEGGILYDTEKKISELRQKHREALGKHSEYNEMSARLERDEKSLNTAMESYESSKKMLDQVRGAQILKRFDEYKRNAKTLETLNTELKELDTLHTNGEFIPDDTHVATLKTCIVGFREWSDKYGNAKEEYEKLPALSDEQMALAENGAKVELNGGSQKILSEIEALGAKANTSKNVGAALLFLGACFIVASAALALVNLVVFGVLAVLGGVLLAVGVSRLAAKRRLIERRDALALDFGADFSSLTEHLKRCEDALAFKNSTQSQTVAARTRLETAVEYKNSAYLRLEEILCRTASDKYTEETILSAAIDEADRLDEFCAHRKQLGKDIYAAESLLKSYSEELSAHDESSIRDTVKLDINTVTKEFAEGVAKKEEFDRTRIGILQTRVSNLRIALAGLGIATYKNPTEIADEICELERELDKHTEHYKALVLAMEHIESASSVMSGSVTPDISRRAGEMLGLISGGNHNSVQTNKSFDVSVEQDGFLINSALLSGGTKDAVYICLRIALMQRLFGANLPPLIMDEALCQLDDSRAAVLLTLLGRLCESMGQCILFTCHSREAEICKNQNITANVIQL